MSFIQSAKRNCDIREFLRDATSGGGIKYSAEKNTKHYLYIPYIIEEVNGAQQKSIISLTESVHEWNDSGGRYHSTICLKDKVRRDETTGELLNDGSCPFCDRVNDAWEIYNIRKEREEQTCGKTGAELEKHMEGVIQTLSRDKKANKAKVQMYLLIAKFRQDNKGQLVLNEQTQLPEYDLQVMKMSANRAEKFIKAVENAGVEVAGAEILIDYPNTDDQRHLYTDSVTTAIVRGTNKSIVYMYPAVEEEILTSAAKFDWEGLEKSFGEWRGMTSAEANKTTSELFRMFDDYKKQLETNPNAKYMEYITPGSIAVPDLGAGVQPAPAIPGATAQAAPGVPQVPTAPEVPNIDVNQAFGGIGSL